MTSYFLTLHGTKLMQLAPSSVLHAAERDLKLRNTRDETNQSAPYAFHRLHVRKAERALDLLRLALADRERGVASGKRDTRVIYEDELVLLAALKLAEGGG